MAEKDDELRQFVVTPLQTNCYAYVSAGECLVVDPGGSGAQLATVLDDVRVRWVVATHGHGDHVGGIAALVRETGAPYAIHAADAELARHAGETSEVGRSYDENAPDPDRTLAEGDVLPVGTATFTVMETPGHTPGGIVLVGGGSAEGVAFVGDTLFPAMLEELEKAERYIFMEYFIVEHGEMWDSILEVLARKAAAGVDVRFIYDDLSCIMRLPRDYPQRMEAMGIRCCTFHRFQPVPTGTLNNRDHRKICVIDGITAFTGGINLADEYINRRKRFGHWLDCGVKVHGRAAYSFALMFLSMWDYIRHEEDEPSRFLPERADLAGIKNDGFVQPYSDTPTDDEPVGESVYINMLSRAKKYVYICTPYLVIDNELMNALTSAAKCGVDVRMITPGVPDKWYVHMVTRSYYAPLLRAGVRVYEYIPGFIHSKTMVCDDKYGVCGTINMDYRSLYLHHECAVWMFRARAVEQMSRVFDETLARSAEVTLDAVRRRAWYRKIVQSLLRVFAPLL